MALAQLVGSWFLTGTESEALQVKAWSVLTSGLPGNFQACVLSLRVFGDFPVIFLSLVCASVPSPSQGRHRVISVILSL